YHEFLADHDGKPHDPLQVFFTLLYNHPSAFAPYSTAKLQASCSARSQIWLHFTSKSMTCSCLLEIPACSKTRNLSIEENKNPPQPLAPVQQDSAELLPTPSCCCCCFPRQSARPPRPPAPLFPEPKRGPCELLGNALPRDLPHTTLQHLDQHRVLEGCRDLWLHSMCSENVISSI
ncbi:hypothetical protein EK904_012039, partial [Melospiza melodia maxima]